MTYDDWKAADPADSDPFFSDEEPRCEYCGCIECVCKPCARCDERPIDCACERQS